MTVSCRTGAGGDQRRGIDNPLTPLRPDCVDDFGERLVEFIAHRDSPFPSRRTLEHLNRSLTTVYVTFSGSASGPRE
jgi:hypothetical protein